ncbi:MAG: 5'-deoxynucleotidase [Atopobiaceae bacterium]|nr:5'-deoxynucleotidase [Atopobiaceae bacterium]
MSETSHASHTVRSNFFAIVSRMKYIERWSLMRNARTENLSEHSLEVSMIAHALATIHNVRYCDDVSLMLDAERCALIGLYHDASEIVTGDMPTPVKYANPTIRDAFHAVEDQAAQRLLEALPEDLRPSYEPLLVSEGAADEALWKIVKAADKISALIKCIDEASAGNGEFRSAEVSTREKLDEMAQDMPEVSDFLNEFLPAYGSTLDELL